MIKALWVARAGRYEERENVSLEKNVAVVGRDDASDSSGIEDCDQVMKLLTTTSPYENPKNVKNWEAQLRAFVRRFQERDIFALPLKTRSTIPFGRIVENHRYPFSAL